jgi:hypothetical protein
MFSWLTHSVFKVWKKIADSPHRLVSPVFSKVGASRKQHGFWQAPL